jgi:ketol-acid reductoisomerase
MYLFFVGKTLFPISKAAEKGSVVMYLLSDAGQKQMWHEVRPYLTTGKTLYFSHGFSIVFKDQTGVCYFA